MSEPLTPKQPFEGWQHLWRQRLRVLLANLANGQSEHREISIIARHIRADYAGRFLIELLQNASDQAAKAHLNNSTVTIVRTKDLLAVTNEGAPFDPAGLASITSLGLSPKDPEFAIGNKGVGFKSVFQVSTSPEIVSAPSTSETFWAPTGMRFRLHEQPFATPIGANFLEQLTDDLLKEQPATASDIAEHHPNQSAREVVLREARHAAPFKYPLPIDDSELAQRLSTLSLPEEALNSQTLVVLPLLDQTEDIVNTALDDLIGPKHHSPVGSILLFLPAITRVNVIDRVQGQSWLLERQNIITSRHLPRGSYFGTTSTSRWMNPHTDAMRHRQEITHWWISNRKLGDESSSDQARYKQEYTALEEATRDLPGEGWNRIRSTTVSVALPQALTAEPRPLGARGRFCIALPTHLPTGSPFWVDARFHGTLDRKNIDFKSFRFNELLLQEAVLLAADIIHSLKEATQPEIRRQATLALERNTGKVGDAFYAAGGLAHRDVVLSHDHQRFLHASEMSLPTEEDFWLLQKAQAAIGSLEPYEFYLPDRALVAYARSVLEALPRNSKTSSSIDLRWFKKREADKLTLLEVCASHYRKAGTDFWEPFLKRILRLPFEAVRPLFLLPVGTDGLAAPSSNVFFAPTASAGASFNEDEVEEIPELVRQDLRFFDEHAMRVRERGRAYTQVAKQLVDSKLVSGPRLEPLLKDALLPALTELSTQAHRRQACLRLLHVVGQWIFKLSDIDRSKVGLEKLVLPVPSQDGGWTWIHPHAIYLGPGWSEKHRDELLNQAYGHTPARRLIPWNEFIQALTEAGLADPELAWWRSFVIKAGVSSRPIRWIPSTPPSSLLSRSYQGSSRILVDQCPLNGPGELWKRYLQHALSLLNQAKLTGTFTIQRIQWIDGLERPESRAAIVEMLLHDSEDGFQTNVVFSQPSKIAFSIPLLWAFALKYEGWPVIPTDAGLAPVDEAWLPDLSESNERYRFLKKVREELRGSKLLNWLGVTTPSGAMAAPGQATRVINALHHLSAQLSSTKVEHLRHAKLMAMELWQLLHLQCEKQQGVSLVELLKHPVPLLDGEQLVSVKMSAIQLLLIDDDPVRARYFSHPPGTCTLPVSSRVAVDALTSSLQALLGTNRVRKTSTISVDTGFVDSAPSSLFLSFLATQDPQASLHMILLLAYGANDAALEEDSAFHQHWAVLSNALLRHGRFSATFPGDIFVDTLDGHTEILASSNLTAEQILHKADALFSQDRRYGWSRYVNAITSKPRRIEDFYASLRVGAIELHTAEEFLASTSNLQAKPLLAYALANWRHTYPAGTVQEFLQEWTTRADTPKALSAWLNLSTPPPAFDNSLSHMDDATALTLLNTFGISVSEWQRARAELGFKQWYFEDAKRFFKDVREAIAAAICAWTVGSRRVPRDAVRTLVERLRSLPDDHEACGFPMDTTGAQIFAAVLNTTMGLLTDSPHPLGPLIDKLRNLEERPRAPSDLNLDTPQREVRSYRDDSAPFREQQALSARESLLKIACALSLIHGEQLDPEALRQVAEVQELSQGWWSNPYSVLRAVHQSLDRVAPRTTARMSEQHAFHEPYPDWRNLWAKFPELGQIDHLPTPPPPPSPKVQILGSTRSVDEVLQEARLGSHGLLGKKLLPLVDEHPPLSAFHTHERLPMTDSFSSPKLGSLLLRNGPAEKRGRQIEADRSVHGMMGELFIYEYLQKQLPGFTAANWVSENRSHYGLADTGQDALGYDFIYFDEAGVLAGAPRTHCLIEVKSSTAPNPTMFFISLNQWEKAQECHKLVDYKYIILLVGSVHETPQLVDKIIDPVAYQAAGKLRLIADEFRVQLGPRSTSL